MEHNKKSIFDKLDRPFNQIVAENMKNFKPVEEERISHEPVIFLDEDADESKIEKFLNTNCKGGKE